MRRYFCCVEWKWKRKKWRRTSWSSSISAPARCVRRIFQRVAVQGCEKRVGALLRRRQTRKRVAEMEPLDDELREMLMTEMEVAGSSDFVEWVSYLDPAERNHHSPVRRRTELRRLAVTLAIPIGTVKWRIFNAKKKLAPIIKASLPAAARRFS